MGLWCRLFKWEGMYSCIIDMPCSERGKIFSCLLCSRCCLPARLRQRESSRVKLSTCVCLCLGVYRTIVFFAFSYREKYEQQRQQ